MELRLTSEITVEEIQHVGDDARLAHAAMVSTKGLLAAEMPEGKIPGLLGFLMKARHGSPFEHGSLTVRVHAPIFVFREWHRHRIGWSYNEESGRYRDLEPVFYVPPIKRPLIRPEGFRSARPAFDQATEQEYERSRNLLEAGYHMAYATYQELLKLQVDRGIARAVLGVGIYSSMYATANPRSIMHFLELRTNVETARRPSKPLYEIANAANQLEQIFQARWPITHAAWEEAGRMAP